MKLGLTRLRLFASGVCCLTLLISTTVGVRAQRPSGAADTRLRPIGQTPVRVGASAVSPADSGAMTRPRAGLFETASRQNTQVQRAAFLQGNDFIMPDSGGLATPSPASPNPEFGGAFAAPPGGQSSPTVQPAPNLQPAPITRPQPRTISPPASPPASQRTLPSAPPSTSAPPLADTSPIARPQLPGGGYATINNCANISAPVVYHASFGNVCGQPSTSVSATGVVPYQPPPATIAAPAVMPPQPVAAAPPAALPPATPPGALVSFGQEIYPVQVGQGLWGQPVAYVTGQSIRNWIRYFFP